jgi:hypothetical protein
MLISRYDHTQLKVWSRLAPGTITLSSRYGHAQFKVRSRSAQGTFMLKSRYGHAQPKVGHGQEFGCDFRTKGSCGGRTQFVLDLTCSKSQRMRKDVAVVALRHRFFGRTPASTRAQRDESLTAGAKRCICINTGRECCHQP